MSDGTDRSGEMTLAFSLPAAKRLADPVAAFEDARTWSRHVGIIDNRPATIDAYLDRYGLESDFDLGERDKWLGLAEIRTEAPAPRYVYVGEEIADRRAAERLGWEYVHVLDAAEKADWEIQHSESAPGIFDRVRRVVRTARQRFT